MNTLWHDFEDKQLVTVVVIGKSQNIKKAIIMKSLIS